MPGAPKPALPTDAAQWVTDYNGMTFTNDCSPYRDLIQSYPVIAKAMDYANLPSTLRTGRVVPNTIDGIWATIDATVGNGFVAAVTLPVDHAPTGDIQRTHFTTAEAYNTYAAKIAHALWLEVSGTVPWKLADYNLADLEYLLHRDKLFTDPLGQALGWDQYGGAPFAKMAILCDHSPKLVYDLALAAIGTPTSRADAISELMFYGGEIYAHGGASPGSRTITEFETDGYTSGCGPASAVMTAYGRSLNIIGRYYVGKYVDTGHASFSMLTKTGKGYVTYHGDDLYPVAKDFPTDHGYRSMPDFAVWNPIVGEEPDQPTSALAAGNLAAQVKTAFPSAHEINTLTWGGPEANWLTGWATQVGTAAQPFGPPYRTYAEQSISLAALDGRADGGLLPPKMNAANTGQYAVALTTESGSFTMDDAWVAANGSSYFQAKDFTGTITVDASSPVFIRQCKIDGNGGIGINVLPGGSLYVYRCEIFNCSTAIQGAPFLVFGNYIHSNASTPVLLNTTNAHSTNGCLFYYNFIDAGPSNTAFRVTTGCDNEVIVNANTLINSSASDPVVSLDGAQEDAAKFQYNWIDGGDYCFYQNRSIPAEFVINANHFGRNAAAGLYNSVLGTATTWPANTYEDDGSEALSTDTAPL